MNPPRPNEPTVDADYYQHSGKRLLRRISVFARERVYRWFTATMQPQPGDRVLDVGTSDDTGADSNLLEQVYPYRQQITCASLSDGRSIQAAYPGVRHVQIAAGRPLPFADKAFDIVYCNAVLEHVGARPSQRDMVRELCRVAPRRFVAVPNRRFPVEHHTCLPFIHWLPAPWFRRLLRGTRYDFWAREENLNYLSAAEIRAMWPAGESPRVVYAGLGFGPLNSNIIIYQAGPRK